MTMQMISNRYITTEEVRRLTVGSYEHLIARIEQAIRAEAPKIFGSSLQIEVVGTFPGYAIVLAEDGRFVRVKFEDKREGVKILAHENVKVDSFTPDKLDGHLKSEAEKAVDSFIQGDLDGALKRLKGVARFVETKVPPQDDRIVDAMVTFHRSDRSWKKVFQEKADTIRRMVLDEIAAIHEDRLQVKFRSLYDGSVSEADLDNYRDLVIENLNKVGERADNLLTQVSSALRDAKAKNTDEEVVASFVAFGDDLAEDLKSTSAAVRAASQRVGRVDCLGKLYDTFAEDFRDRELAGRFVMKMAKRLGESATP